ncbi:hydrogenase nickel incorporation protein HypB [Puniceicoccales bacterium CK1056]|uniref:Hydrogenase nickel incorporation protein HypB n=1 Tax=Oceanipulchritudo coccoides TaxID=2706888 RepID=A0A6B2M2V5_9BACT|nr:hydrogenase nickel incorporation protein HypB [Oceanipulchritudo coccoides]NDV63083.1 hydrogenase nickel incorporation protein HypB [Oceanipulchritudo coccoides]
MHHLHHDFTTPRDHEKPARVNPGEVGTVDVRPDDPVDLPPPGDFRKQTGRSIEVNIPLLAENNRLAAENREHFKSHGLKVINLVSGPGAGKTTLLARTLKELANSISCGVLVGDLETDSDAQRLRHDAVPVAQLTTGSACHLDAHMIAHGFEALHMHNPQLLFIENVGNLVCPAEFDLGETVRVALFACTDGEDKPLKYPPIYRSSHLVLMTKADIAEACGFDRKQARENLKKVCPKAEVIELSSKTGDGFEQWLEFIRGIL